MRADDAAYFDRNPAAPRPRRSVVRVQPACPQVSLRAVRHEFVPGGSHGPHASELSFAIGGSTGSRIVRPRHMVDSDDSFSPSLGRTVAPREPGREAICDGRRRAGRRRRRRLQGSLATDRRSAAGLLPRDCGGTGGSRRAGVSDVFGADPDPAAAQALSSASSTRKCWRDRSCSARSRLDFNDLVVLALGATRDAAEVAEGARRARRAPPRRHDGDRAAPHRSATERRLARRPARAV